MFLVFIVLLVTLPGHACAEEFGLFTYRILFDDAVEITDYPEDEVGTVDVPAEIDGKTVFWIGTSAFEDCAGLTGITLPAGIEMISRSAFEGCTALQSINLPDGLVVVARDAFRNCPSLAAIQFPDTLATLGARCFSGCSSLANVAFPSSLTEIGGEAFSVCNSFTAIEIPAGVSEVGDGAFSYCAQLVSITVADGNASFTSLDGVLFAAGGTELRQYPFGRSGAYIMPPGVTSISESAFRACAGLTSISFAQGISEIPPRAFQSCSGLSHLVLNEGLTTLSHNCFAHCSALGAVSLPSTLSTVDTRAFGDCESLVEIELPGNVSGLGTSVFDGCTLLESITVAPENAHFKSVDGVLFNADQSVFFRYPSARPGSHYSIPTSVERVEIGAFGGATLLSSVEVPDGVKEIINVAFIGCTGLERLVLPASLESLREKDPFVDCANLIALYFLGDAPELSFAPFESVHPDFEIYILSSRSGFTGGGWQDLPVQTIDETIFPAAPWLINHGLDHDTELTADPGGDGLSLLNAYAFNQDPSSGRRENFSFPKTVIDGAASVSFYAAAAGIVYSVEASQDLQDWGIGGVSLGEIDATGMRTASLALGGNTRFLRVIVGLEN